MTTSLVTGGAGFIGSHLVDALLGQGHTVRVLDNIDAQAHENGIAAHLSDHAELVRGDLRDRDAVGRALEGVDLVFHQGGMVGNGQSMYEIARYIESNSVGTAILLEEVLRRRDHVRRLVAASSMVVYGDGAYECAVHGSVPPERRTDAALKDRDFEQHCQKCGMPAVPVPTSENHRLAPTSPYGISKRDTEELVLVTGHEHGVETVALRYLNVYGPRQALSNPYTGVAAIFATRLLGDRPPLIYEDGGQLRDLVHVSDVVQANLLAAEAPRAVGLAINIGTGAPITVLELAVRLSAAMGRDVEPTITGSYRAGDVRHCFADVSLARRALGFEAAYDRDTGLAELASWVQTQQPTDRSTAATAELTARGLIR